MNVWTRLTHENIADFHGVVCDSKGAPGLVSPWYERGSADVYLRDHAEADPLKIVSRLALEYILLIITFGLELDLGAFVGCRISS